jgi:hypothetical protein
VRKYQWNPVGVAEKVLREAAKCEKLSDFVMVWRTAFTHARYEDRTALFDLRGQTSPSAPRIAHIKFSGERGRNGLLGLTRCLAAAAFGARRIRGRFTNQFGRHQTGDEKLPTVVVKIDRGVFGVGFGDHSETILLMLNLLTV